MKFTELDLHPTLQKTLTQIGFEECTPIQELAIPPLLAGQDVAGLAQTGTGKTATFLIPLIDRILKGRDQSAPEITLENSEAPEVAASGAELKPKTQRFFEAWRPRNFVLIVVPTRELAEQVMENAQVLTEGTGLKAAAIYGGTSYDKQKAALRDGVEFIVATPGRLIDLYKEHLVDLRQVRAVVFDEADRMFDMGFKDDMKFILQRLPQTRQYLMFSATLNFDVLNVAYEYGSNPVEINVSKDQAKAENVEDQIFHVGQFEKPTYLISLIKKYEPKQLIIFTNYKMNVERIAQFLTRNGYPGMGISSLLSQAQRNQVMSQFKSENDRNILVATDLAARGLDVVGIDMVINFDLPDDAENYVHRIGRTGRAGAKGKAFSLVSDRDVEALSRIESFLENKVAIGWMESDDLLKEFKPFPSEAGRDRKRPAAGPGRPSREDRERFKRSGGGGDRPDASPRRDRDRDRDRGPRRPDSEARPPRRNDRDQSVHRDRQGSGRHSEQTKPQQVAHSNGSGGGRPQPRPAHPRRHEGNGPEAKRPQGAHPKARHSNGRVHHKRTRHPSGGARPAAASTQSFGQKVSGFFKKIFKSTGA